VKYCVSGGEALGEGIARQFQQIFGKPLLEGYGMTEASPVVAINPIDAPVPGSVGLPLDWAEVKLMADDDREATIWAEGEIWLRGDCVMKGYHNNPAATAATITPDGWLRTGDIGRIDAKGYLFITGRKKELIISGGENISPVEIENVIAGHPAVAEVGVVAMPDESRGEVPKAYVVLRPDAKCTEKDILDYCRERLPRVKQPRVVQFLKEMPRSPAGKILRRLLGK
jgi:long-chain acyl-CoA synthetase